MNQLDIKVIKNHLKNLYLQPFLTEDLINLCSIKVINIQNSETCLEIRFGFPIDYFKKEIVDIIVSKIAAIPELSSIKVDINWEIRSHLIIQRGLPVVAKLTPN